MYLLKNLNLDLHGLDDKQKYALTKLISRVSEASYRRGLQQGRVFESENAFRADPADWRYARNIDDSPYGEWNKNFMTALERLDCEYGTSLRDVGLTLSHNANSTTYI